MARPPRTGTHPIVTTVATNIRARRDRLRYNQAEVERRSKGEVKQRTVSHAEAGKVAQQVDTIARIADALGLQPWQLLVPGLDPANPPSVSEVHFSRASPSDDLLALLLDAWSRMDRDARFRLVETARGALSPHGSGTDPPRHPALSSGLPEAPEGPQTAPEPPRVRR